MSLDVRSQKAHLTARGQEILTLASQGLRTKQIARRMWLSHHTVRNHLKNAYKVLGATDLTEALLKAIARGQIELPPSL